MAVLLQLSLYVLIVLQVASSLSTNGVIQHENENEYLDNFCDYRWPPESSFVNEGGDEGHGRNRYRCCIGLNALQSKVTKLEACCDQVAVTQKHRLMVMGMIVLRKTMTNTAVEGSTTC